MKDKIDLSIEVITSAIAHYIVIRLQKSENENKKKKEILDYTDLYLIFTIFFFFFFSSSTTMDTRKTFDYV
jgi:hypothetical protein